MKFSCGFFYTLFPLSGMQDVISVKGQEHDGLLPNSLAYAEFELICDDAGNPVDLIFREVNSSFETITALKRTEIIGQKAAPYLSSIDLNQADLLESLARTAPSGDAVRIRNYSPSLDRHYEISAYERNSRRIIVTFYNCPGQREKEGQTISLLSGERERLATILSNTPAIIYAYKIIDGVKVIGYINDNVMAILGFKPQEIIDNPALWMSRVHPDDREIAGTAPQDHRELLHFEYRINCKMGLCRWLHEKHNVITDREGKTEIIAVAWDITERKQAERLIQARADLLSFSYSHRVEAVLEKTLDELSDLISSPLCFYLFVSADEKTLTLESCSSTVRQEPGTTKKEKWYSTAEAGPWADCVRKRRPVFHNRHTSFRGRKGLPGTCTPAARVLGVPVIRQNRVVAALVVKNKPVDYTEQDVQYVSYFADLAWTIVEHKQSEEKIRYISFHDNLTGLYNRAFMEEEMDRLDSERQLPIGLIMADLNGLKLVNDTYGHSVGDQMLKTVASILKSSCRKEDVIARWGGDEFIILLPKTNSDLVEVICKRIRMKCRAANIEGVPVSLALGYAVKDEAATTFSDTIKEAEGYMYKRKLADSKSTKSAVLNALLKTLGAKSYETEEHSCRMQVMALEFGEKLGLPDSELDRLSLLITLHDIGKISISEEILTKKGPLTIEEWKIIKKHPETGFRITRSTEEFAHIAEDILAHHERWNGTGYPRGLKGEQIPFLARITAIVDAFEVMTRGRPYKRKLSEKEAVEEITRCSGTQFDPHLAKLFIENLP